MARTFSDEKFQEGLYFLPLGGTEDIGMNMNLYGYKGQWIMVDCGISFHQGLGIEIIMADPSFIVERAKSLAGIIVTHAHEDHVGAIPYLWRELKAPVYTTKFTGEILRHKLEEVALAKEVPLNIIGLDQKVQIGPFEVEFVSLTHSIPEPSALMISTPVGKIFHTGDWKIDANPLIGDKIDEERLKKLGDEGILAMVCDSTNVMNEGESGSEGVVRDHLIDLIAQHKGKGRLAVACFASNVARVQSIAEAAQKSGRKCSLVGRSMHRMVESAKECGYLKGIPPFIKDSEAADLPKNQVLYICTGSQGEPRSALKRISEGTHPIIDLEQGDTVIYSSRMIPGNEKVIGAVQNALAKKRIEVITAQDAFIHVSGHPARGELERMYSWIRPKIAIPVHGEPRHLFEHEKLAKSCGVKNVILPHDGALIDLLASKPGIVSKVPAGRLGIDGDTLIDMDNGILKARQSISTKGCAFVTIHYVGKKHHTLKVALVGITEEGVLEEEMIDDITLSLNPILREITPNYTDGEIEEKVRSGVRKTIASIKGVKPKIIVHVIR